MTAARIFASANPSRQVSGIQPMTAEDARFLELRRSRRLAAPAEASNAAFEARGGEGVS